MIKHKLQLKTAGLLATSALVMAVLSAPVLAQDAAPKAVDEKHIWDLTEFYATDADWEAELERLRGEIDGLKKYQGKLGKNGKTLLKAMDAQSAFSKELLRVWVYASNLRNTNLGDPKGQDMVGRIQALFQAASAATSFVAPEIVALGAERVEELIDEEPGLAKHALGLRDTIRQGAHVLSPETEAVMSLMGTALSAPQNARDILSNAEIDWPKISLSDGTEAHLTNSGYTLHRADPDREDRIAVFDAFWGKYKDFESTFGATLNGEVQANVAAAKARKYENTLAYFLSGDNIPQNVYRTLVKVTNDRIDVLHRYFKLRARMLDIDDLGYHDIYPDLVKTDLTFPIDKTRDFMLDSIEVLGPEFKEKFAKASQERLDARLSAGRQTFWALTCPGLPTMCTR